MTNRHLPKEVFSFTLGNGLSMGVEDIDSLPEDQKIKVTTIYNNWLESQKDVERQWRNAELLDTDWMMIPDATWKGKALAGSSELAAILFYRNELRMYNLTTQDRPIRPLI